MNHFSITQSGVIALIAQLASFVAGFGIISSTDKGLILVAATAAVNAAFLIANAVHHIADSHTEPVVPPAVVTPS